MLPLLLGMMFLNAASYLYGFSLLTRPRESGAVLTLIATQETVLAAQKKAGHAVSRSGSGLKPVTKLEPKDGSRAITVMMSHGGLYTYWTRP